MADYNDHKLVGITNYGADIDDALNALIDSLKEDNDVGDYKHSAKAADHGRWLLCDGSAVSRATYSDLFTLIGTKFGAGNGSTTFNLPNAEGKGIIVLDSTDSDFNDLGKSGGEKTHLLTGAESGTAAHVHGVNNDDSTGQGDELQSSPGGSGRVGTKNSNAATPANASAAHNNLQPYLVVGNLFISFR